MKPVKRRYDSPLRREQAAQTRRRILDAAWMLFDTRGYGRTTIVEIARHAGVAADTVYATFGSKARVLTALVDARLAPEGDESVLETGGALAVRDATDQREQLRLFARDMAAISARVRPVFEILRTASAVEPEMVTVRAEMDAYRLANMRQVVEWVAARGPLRLPAEQAAETVWALTSPELGRLLCDERGWTQEAHAAWLEELLVRTLLVDASKVRARRR